MIQDIKYRVSYYMVLALLFLAALNIYLSIVYYIQLRNNPGVQGPIGPKGPLGMTGSSGKCNLAQSCSITTDDATEIYNIASEMYDISVACLNNPITTTCKTQSIVDIAKPISDQIKMLQDIAKTTSMTKTDFLDKVKVCLTDSNSCMDLQKD